MFFKKEKKKFIPGLMLGMVAGMCVASTAFLFLGGKKVDAAKNFLVKMKTSAMQNMKRNDKKGIPLFFMELFPPMCYD